jgi:hypothetical protein
VTEPNSHIQPWSGIPPLFFYLVLDTESGNTLSCILSMPMATALPRSSPTYVHLIMQYPVIVQAPAGTTSEVALHPTLSGSIAGIEAHADGALMRLLRHNGQCR